MEGNLFEEEKMPYEKRENAKKERRGGRGGTGSERNDKIPFVC